MVGTYTEMHEHNKAGGLIRKIRLYEPFVMLKAEEPVFMHAEMPSQFIIVPTRREVSNNGVWEARPVIIHSNKGKQEERYSIIDSKGHVHQVDAALDSMLEAMAIHHGLAIMTRSD